MIKRDELVSYIYKVIGDELLERSLAKDELANGMQIWGAEKVEKVVLGVSLNEEFLERASRAGSNFCIFHHGFDPRTYKSRYPTFSQKRLRAVFKNDMTVMGFHYALDAHPKLGNNATIIRKLGARLGDPLFEEWGYTGVFGKPQDIEELRKRCEELFGHEVFSVLSGPEKVRTIGVVSGAGKPEAKHLGEMEEQGVELFITGEPSESVPHKMKESGINYFACGHYATEVFGVQELGKKIKDNFKDKVKIQFLDIPNPI